MAMTCSEFDLFYVKYKCKTIYVLFKLAFIVQHLISFSIFELSSCSTVKLNMFNLTDHQQWHFHTLIKSLILIQNAFVRWRNKARMCVYCYLSSYNPVYYCSSFWWYLLNKWSIRSYIIFGPRWLANLISRTDIPEGEICLCHYMCSLPSKRSMRQLNTITAYLTPSPFRIKADRIFSFSNFTLTGNTVSCHVEFIACNYLLRA